MGRGGVVMAAAVLLAAATAGAQRAESTAIGLTKDPAIAAALAAVDAKRIRYTDSMLVSFGTRHTLSDTVSATRGIGAARRFLYAELRGVARDCGGCLRVEYDTGTTEIARFRNRPSAHLVNVLAWLPGRDTSRVVVVGGHYDSCVCSVDSQDATSDAPGADDDGSGTSLVVELARVMATKFPKGFDATIVFALYAGEENGLLGSTQLAKRLHAEGRTVVAAFTNDIVGNVTADDGRSDSLTVRVFGVDSAATFGGELARYVWGIGSVYQPAFAVRPVMRLDRLGRGGDHAPFYRLGDPALRFTERYENYKRQHLPTDTLGSVDFRYVARVARLNLATTASLAAAPPPPKPVGTRRDRESGGQKWRLDWRPAPGATSYEVLFRLTTAPTWQRVLTAGKDTTFLLDEQLDDGLVAVRAVGAKGHRSLTAVFAPTGR